MRGVVIVGAIWLVGGMAAVGCSEQKTECEGVLVANKCYPCPGHIADGVCIEEDATPEFVCSSDAQCLPEAVCIAGKCDRECTKSANCPEGAECVLYRCVADALWEPDAHSDVTGDVGGKIPCKKHVECDKHEMACIDGYCDRECTQDWQCDGEGAVCEGYMCRTEEPVPDVKDTTEEELPPGCDPDDGPYGASCSCQQECESSMCIVNKISGFGMCTQLCVNDAQCPGPDICVQAAEQTSVCLLNDAGQASSCDPDQAICYKALFLTSKVGKCACTTECLKAVDCPEGFACHVIGGGKKVCVSTGEMCSPAYNPCFGECAGNPQTGVGFCTGICITSADCPATWTCQPLAEGVSVCASPF